MKTRIIVGVPLAALLIAALILGGVFFMCVITLFALAAVYETGKISVSKGGTPILMPAYCFAGCFVYLYQFHGIRLLMMGYLVCILMTIAAGVMMESRSAGDALFSLFVFVYPLSLFIAVMLVYYSFPRSVGLTASCLAYVAPELSDMFAYFGGTWFGKKKLCPSISPNKTVAGSIFAVLGGFLFGFLLFFMQKSWGGSVSLPTLIFTGTLCGIVAQIGDLFASKLKRWAGLKDFSNIFPGHGGILDRVDSLLLCSPVVLIIFTILCQGGVY